MKKILFLISFISIQFTLVGQYNCSSSDDLYDNVYGTYGFYNSIYDIRPTVTIGINLVIIQEFDGSGNYQNNLEDLTRLRDGVVGKLNNLYQVNTPPSDTVLLEFQGVQVPVGFLESTKIQFKIDSIYFYQDSIAFDSTLYARSLHLSANPQSLDQVNIYVSNDTNGGAAGQQHVILDEIYIETNYNWDDTTTLISAKVNFDNNFGVLLAHELGHALSLDHTYSFGVSETCDQSNEDYLFDVFGAGLNANCLHSDGWDCDVTSSMNSCTNNIMGGTKVAAYFSPMQIYRMHKALSENLIRKYVICEDFSAYPPIEVFNNSITILDTDIFLYNSIKVPSGKALSVECSLTMAKGCKISVEVGGKLNINGGMITSECGFWEGIEIEGNPSFNQHPSNGINGINQGRLVVSNGATIKNASIAIKTYTTDNNSNIDWNSFGGVYEIDDCYFINNWRSIAMMKYRNFLPDSSMVTIRNFSEVSNSTFEWNNDFLDLNWIPQTHVSMWGVDGVSFRGCKFNNNVNTFSGASINHLNGIYTIDAGFKVDDFIDEGNPTDPNDDIHFDNSEFNNLNVAIQSSSPSEINSIIVKNTTFNNNHIGAYMQGADFSEFQLNTFNIGEGFVNNEGGQGIRIEGSGSVNIEENIFRHSGNTNGTGGTVGIFSFNSDLLGVTNNIYRNAFSNLQRSVQLSSGPWSLPIQGDPLIGNTRMQIDCNTFNDSAVYHNQYISLYKFSGALGIQGVCDAFDPEAPQVNLFQGNYDENQTQLQAGAFGSGFQYNTYAFADTYIDSLTWINTYPAPEKCGGILAYDFDDACPSSFATTGGPFNTIENLQDEEEILSSFLLNINTETDLVNLIRSTTPDYLKDVELSDKSPYLTDFVLSELALSRTANYVKHKFFKLHYPLSDQVLNDMLHTSYVIPSYILKEALVESAGVEESVLVPYFKDETQQSWALAAVGKVNSPLTDDEMLALLERNNQLEAYAIWGILRWNTPLSTPVMNALLSLEPSTAQWVLNKINQSTYVAGDPSFRTKNGISPLIDLENQLNYVKSEKWKYMNRKIRKDMANLDKASVVSLLETDQSVEASLLMLPATISYNSSKFASTMSNLRTRVADLIAINPKNEEAIQIDGICNYYNLLSGIQSRTGSLLAIEESEITTLEDLSNTNLAIASKAKALLSFYGVKTNHYIMEPLKDFGAANKKSFDVEEEEKLSEPMITIYPNPSNGNFIVEGMLPENMEAGELTIRDLSGRIIKTVQLRGNEFRKVIFLENANGVYLYEVISVNKVVGRGKIVIQH